MPASGKRLYKSTPFISAMLLLIAAVYFGSSDGFGHFLLAFVVLPRRFMAFLVCVTVIFVQRNTLGQGVMTTLIVLISPGAYHASRHLADPAELTVWTATYPALPRNAMQKDGVVVWWKAWGFAGNENDSYVVVDHTDDITTVSATEHWREIHRLTCEIVATRNRRPKLYLVTTSNCVFKCAFADGKRAAGASWRTGFYRRTSLTNATGLMQIRPQLLLCFESWLRGQDLNL